MTRITTFNKFLRRARVTSEPDWRVHTLSRERHLGMLLRAYDISCVLDVGANLGQFRDLLAHQIGWEGPVISFEPVRRYFNVIKARSMGNPAWQVHNYSLGNEDGVREIAVFDAPGVASMQAREKIRVRRLADVFEEVTAGCDVGHVLLKVDAGSNNLEVLRGAAAVLPRVSLLQVELSFQQLYGGMPDFAAVWRETSAGGFDVSGMFPVAMDEAHRAVEIDCMFVSRNKACESGLLPYGDSAAAPAPPAGAAGMQRAVAF
jgi:FkbM family methyltransferase